MEGDLKEVFFDKYCKTCKYEKVAESESPCDECLDIPARTDSHKPERWEEKEK